MSEEKNRGVWDRMTPNEVAAFASTVFVPQTPISTRELFQGRWDQLTAVTDAVSQIGLHVLIFGERGVGKTSLANIIKPVIQYFDGEESVASEEQAKSQRLIIKSTTNAESTFASLWLSAFEEITWNQERQTVGFMPILSAERVSYRQAMGLPNDIGPDITRRALQSLPIGSVFIFDEFDRVDRTEVSKFTDLIKSLSDYAVPVTVVLVGVAQTVDNLIYDHASIVRALKQVFLPRMGHEDLMKILENGETKLGMRFDPIAANRIISMSQGLPHFTHLIGLNAVREACKELSQNITTTHVSSGIAKALDDADQSIRHKYSTATRSAHKDALFQQVLLACAVVASSRRLDELGYFQASDVVNPLSLILGRSVVIANFSKHLTDFCQNPRGRVLERTGQSRGYRYRFRDPLLPPFTIMKGISTGMISDEWLSKLMGSW